MFRVLPNQTAEAFLETLFEELKAVSDLVGGVISNDAFPCGVEPAHLREAVRSYPSRGGKRLRPALTMWSCGALGGDMARSLRIAAAIEIYHNWTLVHDDIIDGDALRRGAPTAHKALEAHAAAVLKLDVPAAAAFGRDFAILAGDVQQAWAMDLLLRSVDDGVPGWLVNSLARRICGSVNRELISGEALDVEFPFRRSPRPSKEEVLKMLCGKTGSLLKFCVQAGGAVALESCAFDASPLRELGDFAMKLGVAFQLIDDHLGVFGEAAEFGKPICSDFREGKPTILLLEALERLDDPGRAKLEALLGLPEYSASQIESVRELLRSSGAQEANLALAKRYADESKAALLTLPDGRFKSLLSDLAAYVLGRNV